MMATTTTKEPLQGEVIAPPKNAVSVTPKVDNYIKSMLPSQSAKALWSSLPEHVNADVFKRNLWNALTTYPKLMTYPPAFVYREVSKAAALGLLLDPILGEAYIIEAYNGKTKQTEPQLRIGYKGMIKLSRQSGNVAGLWCHEVHENDFVEANMGFPKSYTHKPDLFGERGKIVGYTAVISYKDGNFDFEPMTLKQCLDIRDRSDAWKVSDGGKKFKTPWHTDEIEMCKKTNLRRLLKRQDQSPEMRLAIQIEDQAEGVIDHDPVPTLKAPSPPDGADGDGARDTNASRTKTLRGPRSVPKSPKQEPVSEFDEQPSRTDEQTSVTAPTPPEEKSALPMSVKELLVWIDELYKAVTPEMIAADDTILQKLWENDIEPRLVGAFPPDVEAAQAILREHERRLEP